MPLNRGRGRGASGRYALEFVLAGCETQPGTGGEVRHGGTRQDLGRARQRTDPGADGDGDPTDLAIDRPDLTRVHPARTSFPRGRTDRSADVR